MSEAISNKWLSMLIYAETILKPEHMVLFPLIYYIILAIHDTQSIYYIGYFYYLQFRSQTESISNSLSITYKISVICMYSLSP